ncbi:MAG: hypothetical protein WDZ51_16715 [Pirellulaceae bacterium]
MKSPNSRRFGSWIVRPMSCAAKIAGIVLLVGCSQEGGSLASVSGVVTLDGSPIANGSVLLTDAEGKMATSPLQTDGSYSLECVPGVYAVAVAPPPPLDPLALNGSAGSGLASAKIPKQYQDVGTSGLTVEVKDGKNAADFRLDSRPKPK